MVFETAQHKLKFNVGKNDWTKVYLCPRNLPEIYLGADARKIIELSFLKTLRGSIFLENEPAGSIEGTDVWSCLSLAEEHYSIYACENGDYLNIYVQDAESNLVENVMVAKEERAVWIDTLGHM